jgi:tRNA nucleotidyltransferase (CCA-adding enzyme)
MQVSQRLRAPIGCRDLAALLARETQAALAAGHADLLQAASQGQAAQLLGLLERCDAWRRPGRVADLVRAAAALAGAVPQESPGAARLQRALEAANRVDQAAIARRLRGQPTRIRDAISGERLRLIAEQTAATP